MTSSLWSSDILGIVDRSLVQRNTAGLLPRSVKGGSLRKILPWHFFNERNGHGQDVDTNLAKDLKNKITKNRKMLQFVRFKLLMMMRHLFHFLRQQQQLGRMTRLHLCPWLHLLQPHRRYPAPQFSTPPAPPSPLGPLSHPQLPALWRAQAAPSVWSAWRLRYLFLLRHAATEWVKIIKTHSRLSLCPGPDHLSALWSRVLLSGVQRCSAGMSSVSQQHITARSSLP